MVAEPAPLAASGHTRIFEARCYWYSTWFLIFIDYLLVFLDLSLVQLVKALFLFQCLAIVMQKHIGLSH